MISNGSLKFCCTGWHKLFMADIQIEIEGKDAADAAKELLEIPGISGSWEFIEDPENQKEAMLTTIASIVEVVGGTLAIAELLRKWYKEYQQGKSGKKIEKVLIIGRNGQRILLANATIEQIRQILEG